MILNIVARIDFHEIKQRLTGGKGLSYAFPRQQPKDRNMRGKEREDIGHANHVDP